jgi:glycerol uptake facilitator-like aquaporin
MAAHGAYGTDGDADERRISQDNVRRITHEGAIYRTWWEDLAPYVAEMSCTFILTLTFLCNYSGGSDPIWSTTSNAFMMMCLIYAFSHVSGGTMNPSICISLFLSGRLSFKTMALKSMSQFAGATLAAAINLGTKTEIVMGPKDGFDWAQVTVVEILFTGMICFVYLNCASSLRNNPLGDQNGFLGLAVGGCFIAGGYAAKDITLTVMNSAVSVGLGLADVLHSKDGISLGFWYVLLDFLGAFLGAGLYRIVRPEEFSDFQGSWKKPPTTTQKVAGEFIGTFYVVLTKALNRINPGTGMGPEAWAVAAALSSMVYSVRDLDCGYFNPAVTVSVAASGRGKLWWRTTFLFCLSQIFASLFAALVYSYLNHGGQITISFNNTYSVEAVILAEGLFSFLTSYVVLTTSTVKATSTHMMRRRNIAGYAYGSCHTVGGFAIGNISGSVLNPAVALAFSGLSVLSDGFKSSCMQYIVYEFVGGLLATAAFFVTHVHLYREDKEKPVEISEGFYEPDVGEEETPKVTGASV